MKKRFLLTLPQIVLIVFFSMAVSAGAVLAAANKTDSPAGPGSTSSYSLDDIFERLDSGTAGTQSTFTEPAVPPGTATMHSLNDIMAAAPAQDNAGAVAANVLTGKTFWGLTNGAWGLQTGSMPLGNNLTGGEGELSFDIPDGYYAGKTVTAADGDLKGENILPGVNIFGVDGSIPSQSDVTGGEGELSFDIPDGYYAGKTATAADGDLKGENILPGVNIFGVDGSIPSQSDVIGADGELSFDIPDGYYQGKTATAADSNLIPLNIKYGVTIMGVEGKYQPGWHVYQQFDSDIVFRDVEMVSATEGWAAGSNNSNNLHIYHFDGNQWSEHTNLNYVGEVVAISMVSEDDGWAVTSGGAIYHYDGATDTWEYHSLNMGVLYSDIQMLSATEGWLVADQGIIFRYIEHTDKWVEHSSFTDNPSNLFGDLEMVNAGEGWLVGRSSEKMYHYDGVTDTWSYYQDVHITAEAVAMLGADDGWIMGLNGVHFRYNSAASPNPIWEEVDSGTDMMDYYDAEMISANDGWAVGAEGKVYHWNGSSWSLYADLPVPFLTALYVVNDSDIWAVGAEGYIVHFLK